MTVGCEGHQVKTMAQQVQDKHQNAQKQFRECNALSQEQVVAAAAAAIGSDGLK